MEVADRMECASGPSARSELAFLAIAGLVFAASTAVTIVWCASMAAMEGMPMPGGWTMSMAWMRMAGQSWSEVAATFLGMWIVMMVAMMLPSLVPMLRRYRLAVHASGEVRLARLTAIVSFAYFAVWTLLGIAAFPLGTALAALEMEWPVLSQLVPITAGAAVILAGALQFTAWKARHFTCCRVAPGCALAGDARTAWRHGVQLGVHCACCCANLMLVLLVLGVMDLGAMAVVAAAITAERIAPAGVRVARISGAAMIVAGGFMVARAGGLV